MEPVHSFEPAETCGSSGGGSGSGSGSGGDAAPWSLIPLRWQNTVREIGISEAREAGLSLAHSFATDDLSRYLFDAADTARLSDEDRWEMHVGLMTSLVVAHCYRGMVTAIGPEHDSVALWLPPGKELSGWRVLLRSGLWKLFLKLPAEARRRYCREMDPLLDASKQEVLGDRDRDCYYLMWMGTKPGARGRGYAGRLLRDMIRRADAESRPIYLESTSASNNIYYAKFGFEARRDIWLGRAAPSPQSRVRLTAMVREPGLALQN